MDPLVKAATDQLSALDETFASDKLKARDIIKDAMNQRVQIERLAKNLGALGYEYREYVTMMKQFSTQLATMIDEMEEYFNIGSGGR